MSIRLSSRQSEFRGVLNQITTQSAVETSLSDVLTSVNSGLTPPLRMRAANPVSREVFIDNITVSNPQHGRQTTIQPISNTIPTFTGGSITLPAASGGSITATGLTLAASYTLTVASGNYIKILVAINSSGQIALAFGTPNASPALASIPTAIAQTLSIGYILAQNVSGTIQNVAEANVYQFVGGGGGGGGLTTQSVNTNFTASAGIHYLVDTSAAARTATLPSGASGAVIRFSDEERTWGVNNFIITPATGERIDGFAINETLICDLTGAIVQLMWDGSKWVIDTNGLGTTNSGYIQVSITSNTTGVNGRHYLADTTSSAFTLTLPTGVTGNAIKVTDAGRTWHINNLTIAPATGQRIDGLAIDETLVCNTQGGWVELLYNGTTWVVGTTAYAATAIPLATGGVAGLYQAGVAPGLTTGASIGSGFIGEKLIFTTRTVSAVTSGVTANASPLATLTAGVWLINWYIAGAVTVSTTGHGAFISTNSSNDSTGNIHPDNVRTEIADAAFGTRLSGLNHVYTVGGSTPIYAKAISYGANRNVTIGGEAVRIA